MSDNAYRASETDPLHQVALTSAANDRLLKALIALLALKEPGLLKELETIFTLAARENSVIGDATEATWERIESEMDAIDQLLGDGVVVHRASANH
jgi:hypothetical protein